jgi:hypothetical protein
MEIFHALFAVLCDMFDRGPDPREVAQSLVDALTANFLKHLSTSYGDLPYRHSTAKEAAPRVLRFIHLTG